MRDPYDWTRRPGMLDAFKTVEALTSSGVLDAFRTSSALTPYRSVQDVFRYTDPFPKWTSDVLKSYRLSDTFKVADAFRASSFADYTKVSDAFKLPGISEYTKLADVFKTSSMITDDLWKAIRPAESFWPALKADLFTAQGPQWQATILEALDLHPETFAEYVRETVEEVPVAGDELEFLAGQVEASDEDDQPTLADWLLWLSIPRQRRIFLGSLGALNELTKWVGEQFDLEPPAHIATLTTFLIAVTFVLSEIMDRPDDR